MYVYALGIDNTLFGVANCTSVCSDIGPVLRYSSV